MRLSLLHNLSTSLAPRHYFALLASVIGLTFLSPLVEHSIWARITIGCMLIASLLTATLAVNTNSKFSLAAISLAILSGIMWVLAFCEHVNPFNTVNFQILAYGTTLFFFVIACCVILQDVLSGSVTSNKICGAICVYILIGFCFAMLHMIVSLTDLNSYRSPSSAATATANLPANFYLARYPLFVYFSFCTLSTVGYGDILPTSRLARSISCLEATFGQLYLAVLVARLVSLHTASVAMRYKSESLSIAEETELLASRKN